MDDPDETEDDAANDVTYKSTDVDPRHLFEIERRSEDESQKFIDGQTAFFQYSYDLLGRGQAVLSGSQVHSVQQVHSGWKLDQDVIRTANLEESVQGLSQNLPSGKPDKNPADTPPVGLQFLIENVQDRAIRVLTSDRIRNRKTGDEHLIAPSDPSIVESYMILPTKAAIFLRPPKNSGDLSTTIEYCSKLNSDNLPTVKQTLLDLASQDQSALNVWKWDTDSDPVDMSETLQSVLPYTIHPTNSLAPRTPSVLSLLDTFGLGNGFTSLTPEVAAVMWSWISKSQTTWLQLFTELRQAAKIAIEEGEAEGKSEAETASSGLWAVLKNSTIKELATFIAAIRARSPRGATALVAAFQKEAQGDAIPLVYNEIQRLNGVSANKDQIAIRQKTLEISRAYNARRAELASLPFRAMVASPIISTCEHAPVLEAIRNMSAPMKRAQLLQEFVDKFQGNKHDEWMVCSICNEDCVCYHEIMELEAITHPSQYEKIRKQILVKYGGDRYEGKIVCRECGQPLQDIDFDDQVEFDDDGRPILMSSVLTDEQMGDAETAADVIVASLIPQFASKQQQYIANILQTISDRGGLDIPFDIQQRIVRSVDIYVTANTPQEAKYTAQRTEFLRKASTRLIPEFNAFLDLLRVTALVALLTIEIQTEPLIRVNNPLPLCKFSRRGYPLDPAAQPNDGTIMYLSCVVASIAKSSEPWNHLIWAGIQKLDGRIKQVMDQSRLALLKILGEDAKAQPLPITPDIRQALQGKRKEIAEKTEAAAAKDVPSRSDKLPVGFRPDPFPPHVDAPIIESTPNAGRSPHAIVSALRRQAISSIEALHASAGTGASLPLNAYVMQETQEMQDHDANRLLAAQNQLLRINGNGTRLWPVVSLASEDKDKDKDKDNPSVDESVMFQLFMKFCYKGTHVGHPHEFTTGNSCRRCGLSLGSPIRDITDFPTQQEYYHSQNQILTDNLGHAVTVEEFGALSDAVKRSKATRVATATGVMNVFDWITQLQTLVNVDPTNEFGTILTGVLSAATAASASASAADRLDLARLEVWAPFIEYYDGLVEKVVRALTPSRRGGGRQGQGQEIFKLFELMTADPFLEGPTNIQEYWCSKTQAAAKKYAVVRVSGPMWVGLASSHIQLMNALITGNSQWYSGSLTDDSLKILEGIAKMISPFVRVWIRTIRSPENPNLLWTTQIAQRILRTIVLRAWVAGLTPGSELYVSNGIAKPDEVLREIVMWTGSLMLHANEQTVKYSKDRIKQILQDRAAMDRESIVKEFADIKDEDRRGAQLMQKRFKMGRWGLTGNIQKYDADMFEHDREQRHRMGIVEQPYAVMNGQELGQGQENPLGFGNDAGAEGNTMNDAEGMNDGDNY